MMMITGAAYEEMEYIDVSRHARKCEVGVESSARLLEQRPNESLLQTKRAHPD
jgi:hypothetical protein